MKLKTRIIVALMIVLLMIVTVGIITDNREAPLRHVTDTKSNIATIFVPGFGGNRSSTINMTSELQRHHLANRALQITVSKTGNITAHQSHPLTGNPLIEVSFENRFDKQAASPQFSKVMTYLKANYHIQTVNLVGHSDGANIAYNYLTSANYQQQPTVSKFVSFSSNYSKQDAANAHRLPATLQVLILGGLVGSQKSDLQVTQASQLASKQIFAPFAADCQTKFVDGPLWETEHSMQHESPLFTRQLANFLWKTTDD